MKDKKTLLRCAFKFAVTILGSLAVSPALAGIKSAFLQWGCSQIIIDNG